MNERILTYRSENADAGREWLALIQTPSGTMLVFAQGSSEAEVVSKMTTFAEAEKTKGSTLRAPSKSNRTQGALE